MPQASNLTIDDETATAKTFELISPAAGDGGIAEWALKEGAISSVFPRLTASAAKTANRGRNLKVKLRVPSSYTDTVTGLTNVNSAAEMNVTVSMPDTFPEALKDRFVAFATGAFQQTLMRAMMRDAQSAV